MKAKLSEAKRNLATLSARQKAAEVRKGMLTATTSASDVSIDDAAFQKFERMRERVEQTEAEAEALAELHDAAAEISEPWSTRESAGVDLDVEAQLAEMKRKKDMKN